MDQATKLKQERVRTILAICSWVFGAIPFILFFCLLFSIPLKEINELGNVVYRPPMNPWLAWMVLSVFGMLIVIISIVTVWRKRPP